MLSYPACLTMTCFNFLKICKSALCLVLLLGFFLSYASSVNLQDENVNADSIVTDLKEGNRKVFAIGNVGSQLTLFVSDNYEVAVTESKGVFKITGDPKAVASVPGDASVKFVCTDSTGSFLVGMSSSSVGALQLPSGSYEKTGVTRQASIVTCFDEGSIHLASSESLHYYTFNPSDGTVQKFQFDSGKNIPDTTGCNRDPSFSGHLCISGKSISLKDKCDGSPPSNLISGFVGSGTVYLIDTSNTVYTFSSSVFASIGQSAKLTKISSKDAFVGKEDHPVTSGPEESTTKSSPVAWIVAIVLVLLVIVIIVILGVTCYRDPWYEKCRGEKEQKDKKHKKDSKHGDHKASDGKSSSKRSHSKEVGSSRSKKSSHKHGGSHKSPKSNRKKSSRRKSTSAAKLSKGASGTSATARQQSTKQSQVRISKRATSAPAVVAKSSAKKRSKSAPKVSSTRKKQSVLKKKKSRHSKRATSASAAGNVNERSITPAADATAGTSLPASSRNNPIADTTTTPSEKAKGKDYWNEFKEKLEVAKELRLSGFPLSTVTGDQLKSITSDEIIFAGTEFTAEDVARAKSAVKVGGKLKFPGVEVELEGKG